MGKPCRCGFGIYCGLFWLIGKVRRGFAMQNCVVVVFYVRLAAQKFGSIF